MARRKHSLASRKAIAIRLQRFVDHHFDSFYAFRKQLNDGGHAALASTVRGWLPPQERWKAKPDGGAVRKVDWDAVVAPDVTPLGEFCDLFKLRADYILFGEGPPFRRQSRDDTDLEHDIAVAVLRRVSGLRGQPTGNHLYEVNVEAILQSAAGAIAQYGREVAADVEMQLNRREGLSAMQRVLTSVESHPAKVRAQEYVREELSAPGAIRSRVALPSVMRNTAAASDRDEAARVLGGDVVPQLAFRMLSAKQTHQPVVSSADSTAMEVLRERSSRPDAHRPEDGPSCPLEPGDSPPQSVG